VGSVSTGWKKRGARRLGALILLSGLALIAPPLGISPIVPASAAESGNPADVAAITTSLKHDFDQPDHPLAVSPIVAVGDWALAGWTQNEMGGRALLRRQDGAWVIWLCAGDGIVAATALRDAGVPPDDAQRPSTEMTRAEKAESCERVAMFSRFQSVVPMASAKAETKR
jgi:hypothetical protein